VFAVSAPRSGLAHKHFIDVGGRNNECEKCAVIFTGIETC